MPPTDEQVLKFYLEIAEHPLNAGLRPLPADPTAIADQLKVLPPPPNHLVRALPANQRLERMYFLRSLHVPTSRDCELAFHIDMLLRTGHLARPLTAEYEAGSHRRVEELVQSFLQSNPEPEFPKPTPGQIQVPCSSLIARSGEGKSRAVERVLARYRAQVVLHDTIANPLLPAKQVIYVCVQCPSNRMVPALVKGFFANLKKAVKEELPRGLIRGDRPDLIYNMGELCETYRVGIIVIDECQHALRKGVPEADLMNFFVQITNTINVPLLFVGTPAAIKVIGGQLRMGRRMIGMQWAGFERTSEDWMRFLDNIWPYQFTRTYTPLSDPLRDLVFEYTQGIPGLAIALFHFAQRYAITEGTKDEVITTTHLKAVYDDYFSPVHPMLEALRSGDKERIAEFEDLVYSQAYDRWFAEAKKLRDSFKLDSLARSTPMHRKRVRAIMKASEQNVPDAARQGLRIAMKEGSLVELLRAAMRCGIDPKAVLFPEEGLAS